MANDVWRYHSPLRTFFHILIRHARAAHTLSAIGVPSVEAVDDDCSRDSAASASNPMSGQVKIDCSKWKMLNSRALGLQNSMIASTAWAVLRILREKGFDAYLVGGCVRDFLLKKRPKDFDIITSADPVQIIKRFRRCYLVGTRFPVCLVKIRDSTVEVASFATSEKLGNNKLHSFPQRPPYCSNHDYVRWKDCMSRDFTINGLMYDPFANVVYDYSGGIEDIKRAKVQTVIPADASFEEDCARILRAFRVAGRLGFEFTRDTACAIQNHSHSISKLNKSRLMMEINYMLAYGAAEASLCLLMRFGVLQNLFPLQAAYLSSQGFKGHEERCNKHSNMLLGLLSNLDKLVASDRPCHSSLWVGLLAFHLTLVNKPQDVLVVTTFCFALYYGWELKRAINAATKVFQTAKIFSPEIVEADGLMSDDLVLDEVLKLATAARSSLISMAYYKVPSEGTSGNPQPNLSNVGFISKTLQAKVEKIFYVPEGNIKQTCRIREHLDINCKLLGHGALEDIQFAFATIILDTLYVDIGDVHETNKIEFKFM